MKLFNRDMLRIFCNPRFCYLINSLMLSLVIAFWQSDLVIGFVVFMICDYIANVIDYFKSK